ncbi:MAG: ATP-binding protein [Nitrosospira sp.]
MTDLSFPGGELASLTQAFDWASTPLGPSGEWPDALKTALGIVLSSNHPMFIWWGPDLIQFYNDAYRQTMGPERHPSALGQPGRECWEEIWPVIGPQIESIMGGGPPTWHEDQLVPVTRHGRREDVWWTYGYSPIRDAAGVQGVLVVCNDVTKEHLAREELKRVNEHLRISEERLQEGMVAARMTVWDWDLTKMKGAFSANASEIFGVDLHGIERPWELLHPDDAAVMKAACERAIAERGKFQAIVRIIHPRNGETSWSDIRGHVLCNDTGQPSALRGISLDVTDRKRAEEKLQDADRRKDEFLTMLAHELRNPLAPIGAAAQLLGIAEIDESRVKQASEIITRQVDHITGLVDDLLDVARVTRGEVLLDKHPVDIRKLLADAVEQVSPLIKMRRHRLALRQPAEPLLVRGDRKRLVQVIANLLNNAAKYTPKGGNIQVVLEAHADQAVLVVQDDGTGIDPNLLPHIFELFTQANRSSDRAQGGLGIGLSLVKRIVELHGGNVTVRSKGADAGAEFTVSLPRCTEVQPEIPFAGDMPVPPPAKTLRVLIADDNRDATLMLSTLLQAEGYETCVEHDAYRVLERAHAEAPDICLLDIGLPGMDGNEIARRLRSTGAKAQPVLIAITGYGQDSDRKISFEAGFDHYFVKPVDVKKLVALLNGIR